MPERMTKTEKRLVARGRREGRIAEADRNRMNEGVEGISTLAAAWGAQKWLADVATPMLPGLPVQYTLGGLLVAYGMRGRSTWDKAVATGVGTGMIASQVGVAGYKAKTPIFGP